MTTRRVERTRYPAFLAMILSISSFSSPINSIRRFANVLPWRIAKVPSRIAHVSEQAKDARPGASFALGVRYQVLALDGYALAWFGNAVHGLAGGWVRHHVESDHLLGLRAAFGDQRTALEDLHHVLHGEHQGTCLACPLDHHP